MQLVFVGKVMVYVDWMEFEMDYWCCVLGLVVLFVECLGEVVMLGIVCVLDQVGGFDWLQVGKQIQVGWVVGVVQFVFVECLVGVGVYQLGWCDEIVQWLFVVVKQFDVGGQVGFGFGVVEGIEFFFLGVDVMYEVLFWSMWWWGVIVVIEVVESQFVILGYLL